MNITTSELVYINEAAKALKQKDFIIIDNVIIGLDNIHNIVTYITLDSNFISNCFKGIIINQRELSAFIKTLSVESDFQFDSINNVIRTISGGELMIVFNQSIAELACDKYKRALSLHDLFPIVYPEGEAPNILNGIQNMNKSDGAIRINYNDYYMTIFPSILPINKADKLYITILASTTPIFFARFRINKKKFDIITYIGYYNPLFK